LNVKLLTLFPLPDAQGQLLPALTLMPALPLVLSSTGTLVGRVIANTTVPLEQLQPVICSWPLSGQYGVGSRILSVSRDTLGGAHD
jgi:hypothetical protein